MILEADVWIWPYLSDRCLGDRTEQRWVIESVADLFCELFKQVIPVGVDQQGDKIGLRGQGRGGGRGR